MQRPDGSMRPMTDQEIADAGGEEQLRRIPPKRTLYVGMEMVINGARFRVRKITKKDVVLRGVPQRGRDGGKDTVG